MARLYPGAGAVGPAAAAAGRGDRGVAVTGLAGARSHEDPAEHRRSGAAGAGRAGGPTADWTTRRWLTAGACAALVVLAVLAATGVWVFARSTAISDRLVDGSTPALVASVRLESALVNQETGARGYGLTGEPGFLEPYRSGLRQQKDATAQLRTLLAGDPSTAADLDEVLARAETWQSRFGRPVATAPAGAPVALATERADEGRQDFNAIRVSTSHLEKDLEAARDRARTELHRVRSQRNWIFSLIAAVILALTVLVFAGLRRGVTLPLGRLSEDVRHVAGGNFGHPITASGPADLRRLAVDIEGMRGRLADELAFSDSARERLDVQAGELRRSNAELEQFAYVASHDLQEPLRKVASFCQLLQRRYADQLDDRAVQYIDFAVDGANRMQTLIHDLLAFSRVGRLHTDNETVDLEELFSRTTDALSIAIEESGAQVTRDPLPAVSGDATQLGMLLQNLVSNALKFRSAERTPAVELSARFEDGLWHFAVTDNGIGIGAEYAERVFVIFQRLHTREAYPGNGIGLALCKKIVEFHGGTIAIDPGHAPGARITFTLPGLPLPQAEPAADTERVSP
ncbi:HAMP domain-containing protein [Streptomyces sp. SID13666]|nr:HAMP domain-containing protein [Streptomyces sp. SID13666]NEA75340.1 HAMP domain-containing protein [Streptomyces sp. SID13588]